jgi:glycosyltransferase involved in cell wall biosynthesis
MRKQKISVAMVTTSYPRYPDDMVGYFVYKLAKIISEKNDAKIFVLFPDYYEKAVRKSTEQTDIKEIKIKYFFPGCLQKLCGNAGIPYNLKHSIFAWINIPFFFLFFIINIIKISKIVDIFHAHWGPMGALTIALKFIHRKPVIVTIHGSDLRTSNVLIKKLTDYSIGKADKVIVLSNEFLEKCKNIRKENNDIHFIPNGILFAHKDELKKKKLQIFEKDYINIISVGRLIPERNHDILIHSFIKLLNKGLSVKLILVGDGPQMGNLKKIVDENNINDKVLFAGTVSVNKVSDYLIDADIYVSPTSVDNYGTAVVEAASHALPIITTKIGFPGELIIDKETGFFIPARDSEILFEKLKVLVLDKNKIIDYGWKMYERASSLNLTWEETARKTYNLYLTSLNKEIYV